uniref:Retrovirus-related Pol polyprotein from transposon TNT 1-94 n=1 Tax=Cajanus cajan TaxID=3821 RepID=A0A151QS74_CAJCA|nr:hypothetical protein KK1_046088 [Cajanus cajan]
MSLKERFSSITKGTSRVNNYLRSILLIEDEFTFIGHPVDDLDLVIIALKGLGPSFCEFIALICTRDTPLLFDELFDKLVDFKIFMQQDERQLQSFPVNANYTNISQRSNCSKQYFSSNCISSLVEAVSGQIK